MTPGDDSRPDPVLVVAADYPRAADAFTLAEELSPLPVWLKVGLELFTAEGPDLVRRLRAMNIPVFLDLKFHDIPNTVKGAVRSACGFGVSMLTIHLAGGEAMCRAAVEGRADALADARTGAQEQERRDAAFDVPARGMRGPLLMGVTVLTSEGSGLPLRERVVERALLAKACGLDGVVCSGLEADAVKEACGHGFLCLCPGIRFAEGQGNDDQARVCTPARAVMAGADFIVMGRPIIRDAFPARAARAALEDMHNGLAVSVRAAAGFFQ